jgi:hypothetical protein
MPMTGLSRRAEARVVPMLARGGDCCQIDMFRTPELTVEEAAAATHSEAADQARPANPPSVRSVSAAAADNGADTADQASAIIGASDRNAHRTSPICAHRALPQDRQIAMPVTPGRAPTAGPGRNRTPLGRPPPRPPATCYASVKMSMNARVIRDE